MEKTNASTLGVPAKHKSKRSLAAKRQITVDVEENEKATKRVKRARRDERSSLQPQSSSDLPLSDTAITLLCEVLTNDPWEEFLQNERREAQEAREERARELREAEVDQAEWERMLADLRRGLSDPPTSSGSSNLEQGRFDPEMKNDTSFEELALQQHEDEVAAGQEIEDQS